MNVRIRVPAGCIALCLAATLFGCGNAARGLEDDGTPLLTIAVNVTGELGPLLRPGRSDDGIELRAALVWAGVAAPARFCLQHAAGLGGEVSATKLAEAGCPDVFGVVPGLVQAEAPVVDGKAKLALQALPSAEVLVGAPQARVGYASIVIYQDRNGNDALDLTNAFHSYPGTTDHTTTDVDGGASDSKGGAQPDAAGVGRRNSGPGREFGQEGPNDVGGDPDRVWGSSFVSIREPHVRIAYREGGWVAASLFYPAFGCEPPASFSLMHVSGSPTKATCTYSDITATAVDVPLQASETVAEARCRPYSFHYHDTKRIPDLSLPYLCVSKNELLVANAPGGCKGLAGSLLRGCRKDPDCDKPDWDDTKNPPKWWPCGTPEAGKK